MDLPTAPRPSLDGPATPSPQDALDEAARLSARARRSTRWYSRYLLVFAAGSVVVSVLTGVLRGPSGTLVTMLLWAAFIVVTTLRVARQQTALQGMTRLHLAVMVAWGLIWTATVLLGEHVFPGRPAFWLLAGLVLALPPLVGALVAHRRTA